MYGFAALITNQLKFLVFYLYTYWLLLSKASQFSAVKKP